MTINSVTNMSQGAKVLNAKIGETGKDGDKKPVVQLVLIAPGETVDMEILNPDEPVFKALKESGDIVVSEQGQKPETPAEKAKREEAEGTDRESAARKAGYDEGYAKAQEEAKAKKPATPPAA